MKSSSAFSLVELLVVMLILISLATVAVPRMPWPLVGRTEAQAVAVTLKTDLRRTRSLALSDAASSPAGYALTLTGSAPHHRYQIRNLQSDTLVDTGVIAEGVQVTGVDGRTFHFGPLGNLHEASATQLQVVGNGHEERIGIVPATGMVLSETGP